MREVRLATKEEMVAGVKEFALSNYNRNGWDFVVECMTDAEIEVELGKACTIDGAIRKIYEVIRPMQNRRIDIEATKF